MIAIRLLPKDVENQAVFYNFYTVQADIPVTGVSRGEECQSTKTRYSNRRTDYMFRLR